LKEKGVKWWMLVAVVELVVMVVELVVVNANVGGSKVINAEKEVQGRRDEREEGGRESLAGRNRMMAKRKEGIEVKTEWNNQSKEPKNQQRQHPARNIRTRTVRIRIIKKHQCSKNEFRKTYISTVRTISVRNASTVRTSSERNISTVRTSFVRPISAQ
jgi:hypothetical protein